MELAKSCRSRLEEVEQRVSQLLETDGESSESEDEEPE